MNKPRLIFTFSSLAVTVVIYVLYAHVLVPVMLPAKERPDKIAPENGPLQDRELLGLLFPEDSWIFEGTDTLSISEGAGMVLFKEFENLENNQWRVSPCVVIWFPSNSDELTPEEKYRQAIVLEASNHALLELEGAVGIGNLQLKNGQLNGLVTIRSKMKKPDTSDDIELITSDVLFNFSQIQTQQEVRFRFGPNFGYGRQLAIEMANTDVSKQGQTPNTIKRIELGRLSELRLYVENDDLTYTADGTTDTIGTRHRAAYPQGTQNTGQASPSLGGFSLLGDVNRSASTSQASSAQTPTSSSTSSTTSRTPPTNLSEVLILCQGMVDMAADSQDASQWLLTFRNQVDVIRTNPTGGATDQLNCQELMVTFGRQSNDALNATNNIANAAEKQADENALSNFGSLSPLKVRAVGTPVIARSPENKGFQAVGKELEIDLVGKKISLTQGDTVSVVYDGFNIKGKALYYAFAEKDGPGMLDMPGAGTIEGTTGTDRDKHVRLEWNDEMKMLPDKSNPNQSVVQIRGVKASIDGIGNASADEVLIWCDTRKKTSGSSRSPQTVAAADGKMNFDMKKLLMRNNVILRTDTGEIITTKLEMTFQEQPALATNASMTNPTTTAMSMSAPTRFVAAKPVQSSGGGMSRLSIFGNQEGGKSFYTVRADEVDVLAHTEGNKQVVDQIVLIKNVQLDERLTAAGDEEPIHVSGQTVRITAPDSEQMKIGVFGDANVLGGHAVFQGRGAILMGANINIDRGKNLFWVDGKGRLQISQLPASGSAEKKAGAFESLFTSTSNTGSANQSVVIDWVGSMEFNGKELLFLKDVDVNYSMMAINKSELIRIHLTKPFYFFEKNAASAVEPERIVIRGNIDLERDTFAENGKQQTRDKIRLTEVEIFPLTGLFKGAGPGYVSSIFQYDGKSANSLLSGSAGNTTATSTAASSSNSAGLFGNGLKFMQCNFNGSVEGNYKTGQVRFLNRVVTVMCPARSFHDEINTNNSRAIVANGMLLECDKLEINQMQQGVTEAKTIDLKAEGSTLIEMTYDGRYYLANAEKIKFDQAKTLFTLEGGRNTAVELYEAPNMNSPTQKRVANERISLNPVTKEVRVEGLSGSFMAP